MYKFALCITIVLSVATGLMAQGEVANLAPHDTMDIAYSHDPGLLTNNTAETAWVDSHLIHIAGAPSLRIMFDEVVLGENDWIEVYGHKDGYRHKLTIQELAKWQSSSAAFNGEKVTVYLYLAPGSSGSYVINEINAGLPLLFNPLDTICGNDDRVVSSDPRAARFSSSPTSSGGCTIWLAGSDSCALSAGHCFSSGSLQWAEFNVPPSTSSGANQHPPIQDQYPVDMSTIQYTNGGTGNDFGACLLLANNLGQMPAANQGHYTLGFFVPSIGDPIRITGYGTDSGVANQVQQTNVGPFAANPTPTHLGYTTDTTGGNSGSPVIDETSGQAIGIHTHGGCGSSGGYNTGTSLTHTGFQTIYAQICNQVPTAPVAAFNASATTVLEGTAVNFIDTSSGVPTSWAWDLDGDGTTDATTSNPSYTYNTAGTYSVTLTVTNALGSDTLTKPNHITVNAITPASLPYSEDFTGGMPTGGEWMFQSSDPVGRITTGGSGSQSPVSGDPAMMMDVSTSGTYNTNDAILLINMAGQSGVVMTYYFKETSDEPDPEDGLFISDGVNEVLAQDHGAAPSGWSQFTVNISNVASAAGLNTSGVLRINFRQRDNYSIPTDGHLIDDIVILGSGAADIGQANSANASLDIVGAVDQYGLVPSPTQNGPFFATLSPGTVLDLTVSGQPNRDFLLLAGGLNRNNAVFPNLGSMDIGFLGGSGIYTDIDIVMNGLSPTNFFDMMANTGTSGSQSLMLSIPNNIALGIFGTFQAFVSAPGGFKFTAATEIAIQ